ncbi:WD40/YVTN/BNR-like repeat-containing protein [Dermacoccus nishinomiyaensis]|uniref:WD40/YVTN/BNR-like repeat-containing protein n=1 Tax=Dermacoccus nishinomiyaensis TaxID=1274 RepID=UPI00248ED43D|nr:sialidase family protein [Dermacoccus nishinomiyaensis]
MSGQGRRPSTADRWHRLRRSPSMRAALALVLAALGVVAVIYGARAIVRDPLGTSTVRAGQAVGGGVAAEPSSGSSPNVEIAQAATPASTSSIVWALSARFGQTQFALAQTTCAGTPCPALLRTQDGGRTWQQVHSFTQADVSSAQGDAQPLIQPAGAISDLRFLDARTGYLFGSDLWVTHDGGRSFTQVQHPGVSVLDVAVHDGQAHALTAASCIQGGCTGRLEVARIGTGRTPAVTDAVAGVTPPGEVSDAGIVTAGENLLVLAHAERSGGEASGAWRLTGDALTPLSTPPACNGKTIEAATGLGATSRMVAVCDAVVTSRSTSYSTVTSVDGGATWQLVGAGNLTLPTQGHVTIAAKDPTHVVAVSGGPREALDGTTRSLSDIAVAASKDGGASWTEGSPTSRPSPGGFDSLQASQPGVAAVTRHDGDIWTSADDGVHWSRHAVGAR